MRGPLDARSRSGRPGNAIGQQGQVFVTPPYERIARGYEFVKHVTNQAPSLGLLHLAAEVRNHGYEPSIIESEIFDMTVEEVVAEVVRTRTAFLGRRLKLAEDSIPYPRRFAVYNHFRGVRRAPGKGGGNIVITRLGDGWFWAISLDRDKTSVGVVRRASATSGGTVVYPPGCSSTGRCNAART